MRNIPFSAATVLPVAVVQLAASNLSNTFSYVSSVHLLRRYPIPATENESFSHSLPSTLVNVEFWKVEELKNFENRCLGNLQPLNTWEWCSEYVLLLRQERNHVRLDDLCLLVVFSSQYFVQFRMKCEPMLHCKYVFYYISYNFR